MTSPIFSNRKRAFHLGSFPLERMIRQSGRATGAVPAMQPVDFARLDRPSSLVNALDEYQSMLDAIRDGLVNKARAEIPDDPQERANHLKSFAYFNDAAMVGICELPAAARLENPIRNPGIDRLLQTMGFAQLFDVRNEACEGYTHDIPAHPSTESEIRERVIEAHKTLMAMSEANRDAFQDLVRTLEAT